MAGDTGRRREGLLVAALLLLSGVLSLGLAWQHVALRDAWRVQELSLTQWQANAEPP